MKLYWVEGTIDGKPVCGFVPALSSADARSRLRGPRGRPRRGRPALRVESAVPATGMHYAHNGQGWSR